MARMSGELGLLLGVRPSTLLGADAYLTNLECLILDYMLVAEALEHQRVEPPRSVSDRVKKRRRGWHPPRIYT